MRWEDERYVRVYIRDTADWLALSFEAQGLLPLVMRKLDRSGRMALGRHGLKAVAITIGHQGRWDVIEPALRELLADGCFVIETYPDRGEVLLMPNYKRAQEAVSSGAKRTAEWRDRVRDDEQFGDEASRDRDEASPDVTSGDGARRDVTRGDSFLPSGAVPSEPSGAVLSLPLAPRARASEPKPAAEVPADLAPAVEWIVSNYPDVKSPETFVVAQAAANPAVDLLAECLRARAWETADPKRAKRNHGRFLSGWFARSQDKAGGMFAQPRKVTAAASNHREFKGGASGF